MLQGLLVTRDELLRRRLQHILLRMGFGEVLTAEDGRETRTRLRRLQLGLRFVMIDADGWEQASGDWEHMIAAIEEPLRRLQVPLVVVGKDSRAVIRARIRPLGQLHYCYFKKPFSLSELQYGIQRAGEKMLFYSQPLIYFGADVPLSLRDELSWFHTAYHPRFDQAPDSATLRSKIESLGGGPAVVLLDPKSRLDLEDIRWLRRFKMTPAGRRCRLVCLSRIPEETLALRRVAEVFWEPSGSWLAFAQQISGSIAQTLYCDLLAEQAKKEILDGHSRIAKAKIVLGRRVDPLNLRLRELGAEVALAQGKKVNAMKEYESMLLLNPCLPQGYLGLWNCIESGDRPGLMLKALSYCPGHPEIRSRSSS